MRRIKVILATVAAVVSLMVVAAPAMAQDFGEEFSIRRVASGAASPTNTVDNTGSNSNLAPASQQTVNTGNVLNEQGVVTDGTGFFTTPFFIDDGFGFCC